MSHLSPIAQHVIAKLGGFYRTASLAGVGYIQVVKWTYPRERGGTGGFIPAWHHKRLLEVASRERLGLTAADFQEHPYGRAQFDPSEEQAA